MARRSWKRRTILIGAIVIALSIGIVFATLGYLPKPTGPHGSIQTTLSRTVRSGNQSYPGVFAVQIPNITISEDFWVGVSVSGGTASFCALNNSIFSPWQIGYNFTRPPQTPGGTFPAGSCVVQTGQISQDTLKFSVNPGTWAIVALNTQPSPVMVSFSPA